MINGSKIRGVREFFTMKKIAGSQKVQLARPFESTRHLSSRKSRGKRNKRTSLLKIREFHPVLVEKFF